jgi:lipooligosaccharide transport system permease protein
VTTPQAVRVFEYWLLSFRRSWRTTVVASILSPALFLAAMGLGLGTYVDRNPGALDGVGYLQFLAPGLLAATAMQTGANDGMHPVMASIKWTRQYFAMLVTPLRVIDIAAGHLGFIATRLLFSATIFLAVAVAFGAIDSWWALLAVPAAALTGMAFAAPIAAFSASREQEGGTFAALNRFVLMPMFLFSGTFFPVSELPSGLRAVAYVTPLWHGVALCRQLALGIGTPLGTLGHTLYLGAFVVVGTAATVAVLQQKLER